MKNFFVAIACHAPSIICAVAAFYLAGHQMEGWGWFLFGSLATFRITFKSET